METSHYKHCVKQYSELLYTMHPPSRHAILTKLLLAKVAYESVDEFFRISYI
jgi:hypothetical protein